jgi:parallel beta-helix repeat protein
MELRGRCRVSSFERRKGCPDFLAGTGTRETSCSTNGNVSKTIDSSGILILGDGDYEHVESNVVVGNHQGIVISGDSWLNEVERNWVSRNSNGLR